jgi:hypothetical protein
MCKHNCEITTFYTSLIPHIVFWRFEPLVAIYIIHCLTTEFQVILEQLHQHVGRLPPSQDFSILHNLSLSPPFHDLAVPSQFHQQ